MEKNKKLILILLIAFTIVVTGSLLLVKMKDLGYFGKGSGTVIKIEKTDAQKVEEVRETTREFSGQIIKIDREKKSILLKWIDIAKKEAVEVNIVINNETEISLSEGQEKISWQDLLVGDFIGASVSKKEKGEWVAKKIQVAMLGSIGAKVIGIEKNKVTISKNIGDLGIPEIRYGVIIDVQTKFFIKDYAKLSVSKEGKPLEIIEKAGKLADVKIGSDVIIYAKDKKIPRTIGDFEASKIEIILNNK